MGLFSKIFHKEKVEKTEIELELELEKQPRRDRKRLLNLYNKYQKGQVLQVGNGIDNKQYILSKE